MAVSLRVIVLADSAHSPQSQSVLIGTGGVNVVEGRRTTGISIAPSEVDAHSEVDLTTSHDVLQE